jgi:ATP-dependent DNA helicase 2 subunit 2
MSKSSIVIGNKDKQKESMALSSLIHALIELESYAVARFVEKDNKAPVMVLLAPSIEAGYECLVDVELPFAEDIHSFKFPPLDKVVTVAGKNLIQHRNLPSDELMKAMSDYVDSMDLSKFGTDADGKPAEYAPPHQTYSPVPHRIQQAIRHRAIYPLDELPPPMDVIVKYTAPPKELVERSQSALNAVIKAADVKKVPPKQKGRKRTREYDKPLSGLNIEALLGSSGKRTKISADNAIPEFKQLLATTTDIAEISDAAKQMGEIVQGYIRESVGDMGYGRAVEALRVMREELMDLEEPEVFNEFVRGLKGQILKKELKGERREMWWLIKAHRLGLIDDKMSELSKVTEEKAKEVRRREIEAKMREFADNENSSIQCNRDAVVNHVEELNQRALLI